MQTNFLAAAVLYVLDSGPGVQLAAGSCTLRFSVQIAFKNNLMQVMVCYLTCWLLSAVVSSPSPRIWCVFASDLDLKGLENSRFCVYSYHKCKSQVLIVLYTGPLLNFSS